jgi:hypothetical protein
LCAVDFVSGVMPPIHSCNRMSDWTFRSYLFVRFLLGYLFLRFIPDRLLPLVSNCFVCFSGCLRTVPSLPLSLWLLFCCSGTETPYCAKGPMLVGLQHRDAGTVLSFGSRLPIRTLVVCFTGCLRFRELVFWYTPLLQLMPCGVLEQQSLRLFVSSYCPQCWKY